MGGAAARHARAFAASRGAAARRVVRRVNGLHLHLPPQTARGGWVCGRGVGVALDVDEDLHNLAHLRCPAIHRRGGSEPHPTQLKRRTEADGV